jgi:hypothetical protein
VDDGYLDVGNLVAIILVAPMAVGALVVLPIIWRLPVERRTKPRRWKFYVAMRMFTVRYLALNFVSLLFLELALIADFFEKLLSGPASHTVSMFTTAFGWAFVASLLITVPVALFNRPKFAVPPRLRNLRGPVELWWLSRKRPVSEIRGDDHSQ